jgi:hypothetical protein
MANYLTSYYYFGLQVLQRFFLPLHQAQSPSMPLPVPLHSLHKNTGTEAQIAQLSI